MGMYDTFGEELQIQLKVGPCEMMFYKIGDEVPLQDGVYVAMEGSVVIKDSIFIMELAPEQVQDKWGGMVDITESSPFKQAVDDVLKKYDNPRRE